MGYPVPAYRTSAARLAKQQDIVRSFQGANDNRPGTVQRLPSRTQSPRYNFLRLGKIAKAAIPFGKRAQAVRRAKVLAGIGYGLKWRSILLRSVARWTLNQVLDMARSRHNLPTLRNPKHPLWGVSGRWGTFHECSGKTGAHTNFTFPNHGAPPPVFAHAWSGAPFDWAEFDGLTITGPPLWQFFQVGRGDQGSGPTPAAYYAALHAQPQPMPIALQNPWQAPYNPSWNRMPGRWPNNFPQPAQLPISPMIDPFNWPIREPEIHAPMPIPYRIIPHMRPNPWRSPTESSRRGPRPSRRYRTVNRPLPQRRPWDEIGLPGMGHNNPPTERPPGDKPPKTPRLPPKTIITITEDGGKQHFGGPKDRKPGPKKKEKKSKAASAMAKNILRMVNAFTELNDFIKALFKGLPEWAKYEAGHMGWYGPTRRKITTPEGMWKALYQHIEHLNLNVAIRAVARNQLEDMIYGKLGAISGKAANKRGGVYDPLIRAQKKSSATDYDIEQALRKAHYERRKHFVGGLDPLPRSKQSLDYWLDAIFGEDT